ncbi:hypothetical protein Tco_0532142 [Tanacetum coccineum]
MEKYQLIPMRLEEEYQTIKDDTPLVNMYTTREVIVQGMHIPNDLLTCEIKETQAYKDYVDEYKRRKSIPTDPLPPSDDVKRDDIIEATQLSLDEAKTTKVYEEQQNIVAVEKRILKEDVENLIEGDDESSEEIVDDDEKNDDDTHDDAKNDENKDDDGDNDDYDHIDRSLIRTQRTGSPKIRTQKMQTPIPSPPRSIRPELSSDKEITKELTVFDTLMPDVPSHNSYQPTSIRRTHLQRIVARLSRKQGIMMRQMKKMFITNHYFQGIMEKVNEALREIVPELTTSTTNDLMKENLPKMVIDAFKKEKDASQATVPAVISDLQFYAATRLAGSYEGYHIGCRLSQWLPHRWQAATKAAVKAITDLAGSCEDCRKGCIEALWLMQRLPHRLKADAKAAIKVASFYKRLPYRLKADAKAAIKVASFYKGSYIAEKAATLLKRLCRGYGLDILLKTNPNRGSYEGSDGDWINHMVVMVEMLQPLGSKEGPSTGPSTGPSCHTPPRRKREA